MLSDKTLLDQVPRRGKRTEKGIILFVVLFTSLCAAIYLQSIMSTAVQSSRAMKKWEREDVRLLAAQSVLEKAVWDVQIKFNTYYAQYPRWSSFAWFDTWSSTSIGSSNSATMPTSTSFSMPNVNDVSPCTVSVTIKNVVTYGTGGRRVTFASTATGGPSGTRGVTAVVYYGMGPFRGFDYSYFVNNFGWFYGSGITANGDIRANGNFAFQTNPTVNGDAYAAINPALSSATGSISGTDLNSTLANYYSSKDLRARPGNPPSAAGPYWAMGYSGAAANYAYGNPLPMPYLGTFTGSAATSDYVALATEFDNNKGGSITQTSGGVTTNLVSGVYGDVSTDVGPDGVAGTPDDGTIVLDGSVNPIVINGPVVIKGDVMIKGKITGQGTIYAGRNIMVAGNITYNNAPSWPKGDATPTVTAANNSTKDLVCFAAKGNIIFGNYVTDASSITSYIKPTFTQAYATDPTDASIGYDTDNNASNGTIFNGDYTALETYTGTSASDTSLYSGKKVTAVTTTKGVTTVTTARRKYYESTNDVAFKALSPSTAITQMDGAYYTNHAFAGHTTAATLSINGSIVARDEAIIFSSKVNMNWDIRLGSKSQDATGIDIILPRSLNPQPTIVYWREL